MNTVYVSSKTPNREMCTFKTDTRGWSVQLSGVKIFIPYFYGLLSRTRARARFPSFRGHCAPWYYSCARFPLHYRRDGNYVRRTDGHITDGIAFIACAVIPRWFFYDCIVVRYHMRGDTACVRYCRSRCGASNRRRGATGFPWVRYLNILFVISTECKISVSNEISLVDSSTSGTFFGRPYNTSIVISVFLCRICDPRLSPARFRLVFFACVLTVSFLKIYTTTHTTLSLHKSISWRIHVVL